jgi:hypothetical protein
MKSFASFLLLFLFFPILIIAQDCRLHQIYLVTKGDTVNNHPPIIGQLLNGSNFEYQVIDTIPGRTVKGVYYVNKSYGHFEEESVNRIGIATDAGIFFYNSIEDWQTWLDSIYKSDSLLMEGILNVASFDYFSYNKKLVIATKTNSAEMYSYKIFDPDSLLLIHEEILPIKPELLRIINNRLYIVGKTDNINYALASIDLYYDSLLFVIPLGSEAKNPKEISYGSSYQDIFILSSPDSLRISITKVNTTTNTIEEKIILPNTGCVASDKFAGGNFIFQVLNDSTNSGKDKDLLEYNYITEQFTSRTFGAKIDILKVEIGKNAAWGAGKIGIKWNEGIDDSIYYNTGLPDRIALNGFPSYVISEVRCYWGINDKSNTDNLSVYPNPFTNEIQLKWEDDQVPQSYNMDIISFTGKIILQQQISKANAHINLSEIPLGIYLLRINAGEKIITKRIVKQ